METAALRLCISRSDPGITGALEAYRITTDGQELQDSLRRIIRRTIASLSGEGVAGEQEVKAEITKPPTEENENVDR